MTGQQTPALSQVGLDRVRLVSSHHLYRGPDSQWRLAGPNDTAERLGVSAELGAELERLLTGQISYPVAAQHAGDPERLDAAVRGFAARGLIVEGATRDVASTATRLRMVGVLGAGPIADQLVRVLRIAGHDVQRSTQVDDAGLSDAVSEDVIVACAAELPDTSWQHLDDRCRLAGAAWHRCHHETGTWVVGPFTVPGRTASYRDTRARRLAAARLPAELAALWRHLDHSATTLSGCSEINPGMAAVVAGFLATDVLAFLEERPVPSAGYQLVVDPSTLAVERHPVLPLPTEVLDPLHNPDPQEKDTH